VAPGDETDLSKGGAVELKPVEKPDRTAAILSDEELLRLHVAGQKGAFDALVERRSGELYRFLYRFVGDRTLADDVLQDTFLQVHMSADRFDPDRRFKPWLFTIAANKARDALRSATRRQTAALDARISDSEDSATAYIDLLSAPVDLPLEKLENQELRDAVKKIVLEMPEHLKEVLLLGYFQQMPYKEIADVLAVPLGTVKSRLHAAVSHFARRWEAMAKRFGEE
jgi:RNA polymerase sigma-70 factor, ECF subfamily